MACPRAFPSRQSGQALVLALVLALASAIAAAFMFSAGQVHGPPSSGWSPRRTRAAWSAGLWRARVMNYDAYANRAHRVPGGRESPQAVTLAAWSRYFETFLETARTALSAAYPPAAPVLAHRRLGGRGRARPPPKARRCSKPGCAARPTSATRICWRPARRCCQLSANVLRPGCGGPTEVAKANDGTFFAFRAARRGRVRPPDPAATTATRTASASRTLVLRSLDEFVRGPRELDLRLLLLPSGCAGQSFDLDKWFHWLRKTRRHPRWARASIAGKRPTPHRSVDWRKTRLVLRRLRRVRGAAAGLGRGRGCRAGRRDRRTPRNARWRGLHPDRHDCTRPPRCPAQPTPLLQRHRTHPRARLRTSRRSAVSRSRRCRCWRGPTAATWRTAERAGLASGRLRLDADFAGGRLWSLSSAQVYFRKPKDGFRPDRSMRVCSTPTGRSGSSSRRPSSARWPKAMCSPGERGPLRGAPQPAARPRRWWRPRSAA